jgi:hypothetical protein
MATQKTTRAGLSYWQKFDQDWHLPYQDTCVALDAINAIGMLATITNESPSTSRTVKIAAGTFINQANAYMDYAGGTLTCPASSTTNIWLTNAGAIGSGAAWPSAGTKHVRLAVVVTDATKVLTITDARIALVSAG